MLQLLGLFRDDNFVQKREPESSYEEVTKISDKNKTNSEKVIAVKGKILEGGLFAITVCFSKKG